MTRGKYAAKAANRLAQLDSELVADLREKLAEVTAERDAARAEVDLLTRKRDAEARVVAERLAAGAVREVAEKLEAEREARANDRQGYAEGVSRILRAEGVKAPASVWADLIDVFGLRGKEMATFMGKTGGHARRLGQLNSDELRRADAAAARRRGLSVATAIKLENDFGATVALDDVLVHEAL